MRLAVIGTGPSGWSTTKKLLSLGHDVTVIDTGLVESDTTSDLQAGRSHLSKKMFFGSDLPYRSFPSGPSHASNQVNPLSSFAKGGLSLVWGATMLPYCPEDTTEWPKHISTLEKYFVEIVGEIPVTGEFDGLSAAYGDFYSRNGISPSSRINRLLESYSTLKDDEISVGVSRLAVETGIPGINGCIYCNKCITGCPSNLIWNSRDPINGATYLKSRLNKIEETVSGVNLEVIDINGVSSVIGGYEKVFLGCGPIETFRILASSGLVDKSVVLKDSATFFLPLIALPKLGFRSDNSFGLAQVFIRLGKSDSKPSSQFQLYEYAEDLISRAQNALPFGKFLPKTILRFALKRMLVGIGYLDGKFSPSIKIILLENGSIFTELDSEGMTIKQRNQRIQESIKRLSQSIRSQGLLPLRSLTQIALPGEGVHFGAWLPMGEKSDLLGRPIGSHNIHVIDSSVLPSIAPGPITFTVMANARRIAEQAVSQDFET
jgi:ferredoxin